MVNFWTLVEVIRVESTTWNSTRILVELSTRIEVKKLIIFGPLVEGIRLEFTTWNMTRILDEIYLGLFLGIFIWDYFNEPIPIDYIFRNSFGFGFYLCFLNLIGIWGFPNLFWIWALSLLICSFKSILDLYNLFLIFSSKFLNFFLDFGLCFGKRAFIGYNMFPLLLTGRIAPIACFSRTYHQPSSIYEWDRKSFLISHFSLKVLKATPFLSQR